MKYKKSQFVNEEDVSMQALRIRVFLVLFIVALIYPSSFLAAERRTVEAEKQHLAMGNRPPVSKVGEASREGRYIADDKGTVLDTQTNLMWAAKDNGSDINWDNAKIYCENYRLGGYTDWRLPTKDELADLYDGNKSYKATQKNYNLHLTELIQLSDCCPWASETRGFDAAGFNFNRGYLGWNKQSGAVNARVLPVRSAK